MSQGRPRIFIGSSTEGRIVAKTLELNLDRDAEVVVWDEDLFQPGEANLERLELEKHSYDVAVLVFTADDTIISRDQQGFSPRDNVVFELGLFVGAIGRKRAFFLYDRSNPPKQPSDLAGIVPITYDGNRSDGRLQSALGPAATTILNAARAIANSRPIGPLEKKPVVYWGAPHANIDRNREVATALRAHEVEVLLPYNIVAEGRNARDPGSVRQICRSAIDRADILVVDLETYGLDTAWELGYADASEKVVLGWNPEGRGGSTRKRINRRPYNSCFMHGWNRAITDQNLEALATKLSGLRVLTCAPFRNTSALAALSSAVVASQAAEIIVPKDVLEREGSFPEDYPLDARRRAMSLQQDCDALLVALPRYGMDTAWQIGYGAGLGQQQFGWISDDDGVELVHASAYEHWTHAWSSRTCVTSVEQLVAVIESYYRMTVIP